ncbi:MAG: hypothetical protein ACP6IY_02325 [Promethearchaeia archaeon]
MASFGTWIKRQFGAIKENFPEIIKGIVLFILSLAGYIIGILLRILGYNGIVILSIGALIQIITSILIIIIFRNYIKTDIKEKKQISKKR